MKQLEPVSPLLKIKVSVIATVGALLILCLSSLPVHANPTPVEVFRMYNPQANGQHFLTIDTNEVQVLSTHITIWPATPFFWTAEPSLFRAYAPSNGTCPSGTEPIYRIYNYQDDDHLLTAQYSEVSFWTIQNHTSWSNEGVAFCAYSTQVSGTTPVYRILRHDGQEHFLTADQHEKNDLVSAGWGYNEGIAFYAVSD